GIDDGDDWVVDGEGRVHCDEATGSGTKGSIFRICEPPAGLSSLRKLTATFHPVSCRAKIISWETALPSVCVASNRIFIPVFPNGSVLEIRPPCIPWTACLIESIAPLSTASRLTSCASTVPVTCP